MRRAAESLQREGLVVKIRRKGTLTRPPQIALRRKPSGAKLLGYLQIDFQAIRGLEEVTNRAIDGLMLQGAMAEAGQRGYRLMAQHVLQAELRQGFSEMCRQPDLCGLILASFAEEKLLGQALGLGFPIVLLDQRCKLANVSSINDDSVEGARQAVRYLAGLGHRRIAYAHWQRGGLNPLKVRGYREGLREARLPRRRDWEIVVELTREGARQVVDRWLNLAPRPTALYCFNNTFAHFVVQEALLRGLRVPQDLSIMGDGGEEVCGLTCLQVDWFQMGRTAIQVLLRSFAAGGKHAPEHIDFPHRLCVGQTTAPPGGGA